ncbi:MAG TPA: endonuclease/exonuclease/phosphatase family protein, partial [Humisphaera sp.]|nr:endonuclease/exonuclease/phosphatase family protein [Humisphaera sp.]
MNKHSRSSRGKLRSPVGAVLARVSWTYLIVLSAFWIFLRFWGDEWWLATLMLFGPLWVTALPLAVLAPAALLVNRRALAPLALAAGVAFFLLMDVCVPWRSFLHWGRPTQHLRVLTCNVHGKALNAPALGRLIAQAQPDVVMLQEAYVAWESIAPYAGDVRWRCRRDGELFIASRYPIKKADDFGDPRWQKWGGAAVLYAIAAPGGDVNIFNLHLASPHLQFQAVIDQQAASAEELEGHLE